jgi:excisionase family DNA binding protein
MGEEKSWKWIVDARFAYREMTPYWDSLTPEGLAEVDLAVDRMLSGEPVEPPAMVEAYTIAEASQLTGQRRQTIRDAIASGRMPGFKRGSIWFVAREDLEAYRFRRPPPK